MILSTVWFNLAVRGTFFMPESKFPTHFAKDTFCRLRGAFLLKISEVIEKSNGAEW